MAVEVPSTLNAERVRFRWKQENFENALEYWALDDVRVSVWNDVPGCPLRPHFSKHPALKGPLQFESDNHAY